MPTSGQRGYWPMAQGESVQPTFLIAGSGTPAADRVMERFSSLRARSIAGLSTSFQETIAISVADTRDSSKCIANEMPGHMNNTNCCNGQPHRYRP